MRRIVVVLFLTLIILAACTSIDCPVQNKVYTNYNLYKSDGSVDTLTVDTLTIVTKVADGTLDTLLNQSTGITYFELDTIRVRKEDLPHFESVDCGMSYFHKLTSVSNTKFILDSVVISNPNVNYDTNIEHFRIYFKARY